MNGKNRTVGWRGAALALACLPMACAGTDSAAPDLADRLIGAPRPDPVAARLPPGGRIDRTALGRPNRTMSGMREAPEILAGTVPIEWDGRPTLPGLWLAHPQVERTHRVRLTNPRTGTVIDAALLPRGSAGRATGPIVSAEAADALGLTPKVPEKITLVAITHEGQPAPEPALAGLAPRIGAEAPRVEATPASFAGRTFGEAEAFAERPAPGQTDVWGATSANDPADVWSRIGSEAPESADPAQDRFDTTATALPLAAAGSLATELAGLGQGARLDLSALAPPEPAAQPRAPSPSAAPAEPGPTPRAEATANETPGPVEPMATGTTPDGGTYVQAGDFTDPAQAADLVRTLYAYDIPASNVATTVRGIAMRRVLAGPFTTREARDRALERLHSIGVTDARPSPG